MDKSTLIPKEYRWRWKDDIAVIISKLSRNYNIYTNYSKVCKIIDSLKKPEESILDTTSRIKRMVSQGDESLLDFFIGE